MARIRFTSLIPQFFGDSGPAPDLLAFTAGHLTVVSNQAHWDPVMFWDELGQYLQCDFYMKLGPNTSNISSLKVVVRHPDGTYQDATETPIYLTQFSSSGEYMGTFGIKFDQAPDPPETWDVIAVSASNTIPPVWKSDGSGHPVGPSVKVQTLAQATRPLSPPGQLSASDYSITILEYAHDDQTGQNYAQMQLIVPVSPIGAKVYSVYQYQGANPPTDLSSWGDPVLNIPVADSGVSEGQWQILRQATSITYRFCVTVRSETYNTQPWSGIPTVTRTVNPVSTPQQPTAFSVILSRTIVGGVDSGTLTYLVTYPNDLEISFVNIERIRCDNPSLHSGSYVPMTGYSWESVYQPGVLPSQLGTQVTYQVQWPWDSSGSEDSWWTFRAYSTSRANITNTTTPPSFNLYAPAKRQLDISGLMGGGLEWVQGKATVKVNGTEIALDANNQLTFNGLPASKLSGTTSSAVVFAGTLAANVAYLGSVNLGQLIGNTAVFANDVWFYRGTTSGGVPVTNSSSSFVQISSTGINMGATRDAIDLSVTPSGIKLQPGGTGAFANVSSNQVELNNNNPSSLGQVVIGGDGKVTIRGANGTGTIIDGNQIFNGGVTTSVITIIPIGSGPMIVIEANPLLSIPQRTVVVNGTFTTTDSKTVTVTQGLITDIS